MAERKPDPPLIRASVVDSGWEPEQPKERELPRYEDPSREQIETRVDDQVQARAAAMNEEARASADFTVPAAPPHLLVAADEHTHVDHLVPFDSSVPPPQPVMSADALIPSLGEALRGRVRIAGGDVPLFAVVLPVLALVALFAALAGGTLASFGTSAKATDAAPATSASPGAATASGTAPAEGIEATSPSTPSPAVPSDGALAALENTKSAELGTDELLLLANGKAARTLAGAKSLSDRLASDPGLAKDPKLLTELLQFAAAPETARVALAAMARLPGPLGADLLYEVWTGTAQKSESTELARALLLSHDVRPKASPALAIALDLRQAETCKENLELLPKAAELGDKRSLAPIARLLRRTGCGPAKRDDCFACLREGDVLKDTLVAVKKRREPELGKR
jgi:hypothetical protein